MNSDDKKLKVDNDAKNKNVLEPITKESSRRSGIPRHKSHSANAKADEKIGVGVSMVTTKRESSSKNPQIHERKASTDHKRNCTEQFKEAASKTVRSPLKQETKYSRVLASSEKSTALDSCKRQSTLKTTKDTYNHKTKETRIKSNRKKSLPRAEKVPCAIVAPSAVERSPRREFKYGDSEWRKGISVRSTPKETEKVDKRQRVRDVKKCSDKFDGSEKIKAVGKQIKNNADNLAGVQAPKIIDTHAVVKVIRSPYNEKTSLGDNGIDDATSTTSGAARTRIFEHRERTRIKDFENKIDDPTKSLPVEEQIEAEQESKTIDSINCNIKDEKMISLNQEDLKTPECSSAHSLESRQTLANSKTKEGIMNQFSSTAGSSGTNCEQTLPRDVERDSSQSNVIDDSAKRLNDDANEIRESLTVTKILQSDSQDKVTHSLNHENHSGQHFSRGSNRQEIENTTLKSFTNVDKVNNDEKYNLMKTLIHPHIETDHLKSNYRSLLLNHGSSDSVLTCKDNGFKTRCTISSSIADITEKSSSLTSSAKPSESHCNNEQNCETWNNTSDYIAMNLKINGCKHTKKYRHYKYEEKNMCCSMARYLKKMVADERRCQEIERKETPERDELKIIIDENSPKTSKIRIVNDRSSVSVVCHSLERIVSPRGNNTAATKTESSGGESSGYRSFHNDSNTKNSDTCAQMIEMKSGGRNKTEHPVIMSHNPKNIHIQYHNPSAELLYNKPIAKSLESNYFNSLYVDDDPVNAYAGKVEEHLKDQNNVYSERDERQNLEVKYKSYETKDYLSTFTNCMDVYLPCEITAYQVEERKGSGLFQLSNKERLEKDVDNAELHIGKYLADKKSYSKDELSADEISESSGQLDSEDNFDTLGEEVLMMKKPDNREYGSHELVVNERFLDPDNSGALNNSTNVPAVPAHHRIVTTPLNIMKSSKISDTSDISTNISHAKFMSDDDVSVTSMKSSNVDIQTSCSYATFRQESTADIPKESIPHGTEWRQKDKHEKCCDSNTAVRELWTNKKTNIDSTDNDSQISKKVHCCKKDKKNKLHGTNRFKFNIFKKPKSSASGKTANIPIHQIPQPPCSFLENSAPSNSTISSSTVNSDPSRSTFAEKSQVSSASIRHESSISKSSTDTSAPMLQHTGRTKTDAVPKENITRSQFQPNPPSPVEKSLFSEPQAIHSAVPPPASALPPPYPFCCPMAPYMMQYWQNNQPPSPETDWKPTSTLDRSEPPPPGMVPIPWFPPMMHFNNPAQSMRRNSEIPNNLRAQPPPEWFMMPRGYAPCLPCSKTPTDRESTSRHLDSMSYDDDEVSLDNSIRDKKRDLKKKRISNKLFNIFRRRNRPDSDTFNEYDNPIKYIRTRPEPKSNIVRVVDNDEQNLDERSIWDSPDIAGIVTPEEIGRCFRRGFRADGLTLSGDNYVCQREPSDTTSEDIFNFSDHDTPLDFLLALGFSVDEATAAIRDDDVRSRFKAALTEARIWVPHIATTQGTLLYLLAMKAKPKVMRYYLQLVESIVNKRITNAVKLDAYLKILEKVEEGLVSFVTLFGKDSRKDDEEDTVIVEKQRRRIFYTIYKYAETEAAEVNRPLTRASVDLLHSLAARYRSAIGPHLRLLASYIGEGLLTKDVQLEAALIYLSRLDSADVKLADLEKYCGLPPSERRRLERIAQTES